MLRKISVKKLRQNSTRPSFVITAGKNTAMEIIFAIINRGGIFAAIRVLSVMRQVLTMTSVKRKFLNQ